MKERAGLLLINLGTPDAPRPPEMRRYLRELLSDPRVLDMPAFLRFLLLELVILPRRPRASAEAYRKIWSPEGSPLLVHGRALAGKVQALLGDAVQVELAMRYGKPSIADALDRFAAAGVSRLAVFPLYPQYSSAATGSSIECVLRLAGRRWNTPYLQVIPPFYDHPAYVEARAEAARPFLDPIPERVFFSFHGLPERQIRKSDPSGGHCLVRPGCCAEVGPANRHCYRAQCHAAARLLAERLGVPEEKRIVCFQSRLGRAPWLSPSTEEVLAAEARRGVRHAVIIPAFVTDCLETLEELAIRGVEIWRQNGGETLQVVPALNAGDRFAEAVVEIATQGSTWLPAAA
ncbi:MAG TPA: ferrochelatase [Thermoanaerobaculia bacterium]|nr:ferrochelatase [Thermoanaerobaculia bacterium]